MLVVDEDVMVPLLNVFNKNSKAGLIAESP
jgi:hypothetical protein